MTVVRICDGKKFVDVEVNDGLATSYAEIEYRDSLLERKETRRHQSLGDFSISDENADISQIFERKQIADELSRAMKQLTEKQRIILASYSINQMSFQEIGSELGISKETAREHFYAAIKKMKKLLKNTLSNEFLNGY